MMTVLGLFGSMVVLTALVKLQQTITVISNVKVEIELYAIAESSQHLCSYNSLFFVWMNRKWLKVEVTLLPYYTALLACKDASLFRCGVSQFSISPMLRGIVPVREIITDQLFGDAYDLLHPQDKGTNIYNIFRQIQ